MTAPSGLAVAEAWARGVELPEVGSFQDVLLEELDYRHRRTEVARMATHVRLAERIMTHLAVIAELKLDEITKKTSDALHELLDLYEAEVYQEIHAPAWQRKLAELSRRKKEEAIEAEHRRAASARKVAAMDDGSPIKPGKT